jgi:hypothetical protein
MDKEQEEPQGFRVTDKRGFSEDGEARTSEAAEQESEKAKSAFPGPEGKKEAPPRPQIDFPSYVLSYYARVMIFLGEVPDPDTNKKEEDLEAARYFIDLLSMLQEKTKGNLSKDEEQLLDKVLYELRMIFMARTNRIKI